MRILLTLICYISYFSIMAQNGFEELNGKMAGNAGWNEIVEGNYNNSIISSRRALKFDSTLSFAHFNVALAFLLKGEIDNSKIEYINAINRAKRYGNPKKSFDEAIDDIINYIDKIPSRKAAENIIETIKDTALKYDRVNTFILHVPKRIDSINLIDSFRYWTYSSLDGIRIVIFDISGHLLWMSEKITNFVEDSSEYLLKMVIPQTVLLKTINADFIYFYSRIIKKPGSKQSFETEYFSEDIKKEFSIIKLNLNSTPGGAEIFFISNRIWKKEFEGKEWKFYSESFMDRYRVNGSSTNTFTHIDETVYMILFKLNGKYEQRLFYPRPAQVAPEQTVSVTFRPNE